MKASKMVACLSVSAVLLSLFASGASVTVPDTQPSAAAVLQAEEYVEDSLAAYLAAHAFDGTLSGRTISLPVAEEGVTSDLEQPVSWTFECEEAGFYNVYVEYIPLPGTARPSNAACCWTANPRTRAWSSWYSSAPSTTRRARKSR